MDSASGRQEWVGRIARYAAVGGVGALLYAGAVWLMIAGLSLAPLVASSLAFLGIVIFNYRLHYRWTFVSRKNHAVAFSQFATVSLIGFAANYAIVAYGLSATRFAYVAVQLAAVVVVVLLNFLLSALWVFRG
jgi:putative flippase GtrA